jgi:hypothetical protein
MMRRASTFVRIHSDSGPVARRPLPLGISLARPIPHHDAAIRLPHHDVTASSTIPRIAETCGRGVPGHSRSRKNVSYSISRSRKLPPNGSNHKSFGPNGMYSECECSSTTFLKVNVPWRMQSHIPRGENPAGGRGNKNIKMILRFSEESISDKRGLFFAGHLNQQSKLWKVGQHHQRFVDR